MDPINILLIDDEEAFVTTLQERLEMRGFSPRVATDGLTGLEMIAAEPPDVVVLDLRMPGLSGVEVLRRIRKQWPCLPVIMLSGHGSDQDFETCLSLEPHSITRNPWISTCCWKASAP
jgi:Response regulator containing CheY-like receiver, AAA-type ATPase, and DNA-binding domains